jgi:hypothetical protein
MASMRLWSALAEGLVLPVQLRLLKREQEFRLLRAQAMNSNQ